MIGLNYVFVKILIRQNSDINESVLHGLWCDAFLKVKCCSSWKWPYIHLYMFHSLISVILYCDCLQFYKKEVVFVLRASSLEQAAPDSATSLRHCLCFIYQLQSFHQSMPSGRLFEPEIIVGKSECLNDLQSNLNL